MSKIELDRFIILTEKDMDMSWGLDSEPLISSSMNLDPAMNGKANAIALSAWWNGSCSATHQLYQLVKSPIGEYGHLSSHR